MNYELFFTKHLGVGLLNEFELQFYAVKHDEHAEIEREYPIISSIVLIYEPWGTWHYLQAQALNLRRQKISLLYKQEPRIIFRFQNISVYPWSWVMKGKTKLMIPGPLAFSSTKDSVRPSSTKTDLTIWGLGYNFKGLNSWQAIIMINKYPGFLTKQIMCMKCQDDQLMRFIW